MKSTTRKTRLLKILGFVDEEVRDPEAMRHAAGVHHGLGAATFVLGAADTILRPELESDADHVVALLEKQGGGGGRVHSSAQSHDHARSV